jgi:hypothetical protein
MKEATNKEKARLVYIMCRYCLANGEDFSGVYVKHHGRDRIMKIVDRVGEWEEDAIALYDRTPQMFERAYNLMRAKDIRGTE